MNWNKNKIIWWEDFFFKDIIVLSKIINIFLFSLTCTKQYLKSTLFLTSFFLSLFSLTSFSLLIFFSQPNTLEGKHTRRFCWDFRCCWLFSFWWDFRSRASSCPCWIGRFCFWRETYQFVKIVIEQQKQQWIEFITKQKEYQVHQLRHKPMEQIDCLWYMKLVCLWMQEQKSYFPWSRMFEEKNKASMEEGWGRRKMNYWKGNFVISYLSASLSGIILLSSHILLSHTATSANQWRGSN